VCALDGFLYNFLSTQRPELLASLCETLSVLERVFCLVLLDAYERAFLHSICVCEGLVCLHPYVNFNRLETLPA
jgi:hypothetical protein